MNEKEQYIIKAPGKLILLGEYAVVEEGVPAVVTSISKSIYCYIRESEKILFTSKRIDIEKVEFNYKNNKLSLVSNVENIDVLSFSKNAMEIVLRYLEELGYQLKNFEINILSDLSSKYGIKFGFGSSAAVTVSIISAILYLHGIEIDKGANRDVIFKLSAIAHFISQGSGSGLDIAASTYGGLLVYQSYTSDWMREKIKNMTSVRELLKENWNSFKYEKINYLIDFYPLIGWTGKAASTKHFLEQVKKIKNSENQEFKNFYANFLKTTKTIVNAFVSGIKNDKKDLIDKAINANRILLLDLSKKANVEMETPLLTKLISIAKKYGLSAKFSGAGGGDCGYAMLYDLNMEIKLRMEWKKNGIEPLNVDLDEKGVCTLEDED
ncbi:MAG: phosphomevalonate kinase [Candidatus Sericytochromatia bacterium]